MPVILVSATEETLLSTGKRGAPRVLHGSRVLVIILTRMAAIVLHFSGTTHTLHTLFHAGVAQETQVTLLITSL
jgi:hypothetical protein